MNPPTPHYIPSPSDLTSLSTQIQSSPPNPNIRLALLAPLALKENQVIHGDILDITTLSQTWRKALSAFPSNLLDTITFDLTRSNPREGAKVISWDSNSLFLPEDDVPAEYSGRTMELADGTYSRAAHVETPEQGERSLALTANRVAINPGDVTKLVQLLATGVCMKTRRSVRFRIVGDEATISLSEKDLKDLSREEE